MAKPEELELQMPLPKTERNIPRRFEHAPSPTRVCQLDVKRKMRSDFVFVRDLLKAKISRTNREWSKSCDFKASCSTTSKWDAGKKCSSKHCIGPHGEDFDIERIAAQLFLVPAAIDAPGSVLLKI